jgi:uncharacterized protein YcbX
MIRIERFYVSPVKSLALNEVENAYLDKPGIAGDRAFYLIDEGGRLFTQREFGALVQVRADYDPTSGHLQLRFPSGQVVGGVPGLGEAVTTAFFGERGVAGRLLTGKWNDALSEFAGQAVRVVKADVAGSSFDGFPLSMCSLASLDVLALAAQKDRVDGRRFRQNIYISGGSAHEEDTWVGREVRAGNAVLRVKMADPRCVITTHDPETGDVDLNTLKIIASYRRDQPAEVNFGVYCTVAQPGDAAVGDEVVPLNAT